jgi:hypothetical protein
MKPVVKLNGKAITVWVTEQVAGEECNRAHVYADFGGEEAEYVGTATWFEELNKLETAANVAVADKLGLPEWLDEAAKFTFSEDFNFSRVDYSYSRDQLSETLFAQGMSLEGITYKAVEAIVDRKLREDRDYNLELSRLIRPLVEDGTVQRAISTETFLEARALVRQRAMELQVPEKAETILLQNIALHRNDQQPEQQPGRRR